MVACLLDASQPDHRIEMLRRVETGKRCTDCKGHGHIRKVTRKSILHTAVETQVDCERCNGFGMTR